MNFTEGDFFSAGGADKPSRIRSIGAFAIVGVGLVILGLLLGIASGRSIRAILLFKTILVYSTAPVSLGYAIQLISLHHIVKPTLSGRE